MRRATFFSLAFALVAALPLRGQDGSKVVAKVDGDSIHLREVEKELKRVIGKSKLAKDVHQRLRKEMVKRLVDKRLILRYLASKELGASKQQIDVAIDRLKKQLEAKKTTLEAFLKEKKLSQGDLRFSFAWQIGWTQFLNRYLTEKNMQRYFERHAKEFDGTQLKVAHILIKAKSTDKAGRAAAVKKLTALREKILKKEVSFAKAAKANSQSPSANKGGDIGFIERHKPMPKDFSKAAFALDVGEISKPVHSPFGVHLIRCLQVKKGNKTWKDARPQLARVITNYLYGWAADQQRPKSKVVLSDEFK